MTAWPEYVLYSTPDEAPVKHRMICHRAARGQAPREIAAEMRVSPQVVLRVLNDPVMQEYLAGLQEKIEYEAGILREYLDKGRLAGLKFMVEVAQGETEDGNPIEADTSERLRAAIALLDRHPDMETAKGSKQKTEHRHTAVLDVELRDEIERLAADAQLRLSAIDVQVVPTEEISDGQAQTEEDAGGAGDSAADGPGCGCGIEL